MNKGQIDRLIGQVSKPVRYMGNEYNMVEKDPASVEIRFAFAFPDVYEIGMSHLGMKILYHLMNEREDTYCERVFAPWPDMETKMREANLPLFALETKDPVSEFDFLGFTLQYELSYTNVLNMLDLARIPLLARDRTLDDPFVIAGGPCAFNCEPLADFLDLVALGEGEELIGDLLDVYKQWKSEGGDRDAFLLRAARIPGIYVPKFYDVEYMDDGRVKAVTPNRDGVPSRVVKRVVKDLDRVYFPDRIIVPFMDIVHDRIMLEIFRGCTKGCRFCQAGMIYRPVRERSLETLLDLADKLIRSTGYEEISLSSLSTGDYSRLEDLVRDLMARHWSERVSLSLPSLRLDSFAREYIEQVQRVKKTGLTFAPEAGTQRLRNVINKGITQEDLSRSLTDAFGSGWNNVKLYFMIGLPTETTEDLEGIAYLARMAVDCYYGVEKNKREKGLKITISTSSFVPKPFTPFQWEPQDTIEELREKQHMLQKLLKLKHVDYSWHDPETSFLEAVMARGDRRIGQVMLTAWQNGARFDSWAEHFSLGRWMDAFTECGLDPYFYAYRKRDRDEVLPWDHIDTGVSKAFLWSEYMKALNEETTPDCRLSCTGCGVRRLGEGLC
ncbi:MAG TPA: TIGR03960 family B12-binding radical SAM protein [Candidatus Atribacteria bacterium]|nr:TIGR03960 family B12-binding radical SAM protein [Candidatus Atribacteria bacterium]